MAFKDRLRKPSFKELKEKAEQAFGKTTNYTDDRIWKPTPDSSGVAKAKIRFLPTAAEDGQDFVMMTRYGFKVGKDWYINKSRKTLGWDERDPVNEWAIKMTKTEEGKELLKKLGINRKQTYLANILVISDTANPENNGKVFLYEFAATVLKKIQNAMEPEFEDETPMDPFHLIDGCDFKVLVKKGDNDINDYGGCEFDKSSKGPPLGMDDDKLEELFNKCYSISDEIAPDKFKSYEELEKRFKAVIKGLWNQPFNEGHASMWTAFKVGYEEDPVPTEETVEEPPVEEETVADDVAEKSPVVSDAPKGGQDITNMTTEELIAFIDGGGNK